MRLVVAALVALSSVAIVLVANPTLASASTTWGCTGTSCQVGVGTPGTASPDPSPGTNNLTSAPAGPSSGPCPSGQTASYLVQTFGGNVITSQPGDLNPVTLEPVPPGSEMVVISCNGSYLTTEVVQAGQPVGSAPPAVTGAALAQQAFASFSAPVPNPVFSPTTSVVNVSTWLWLQGGWSQHTATASVPGLSATVTATPTKVVWNMGDGGQAVCVGPGKPWNADEPNGTTDCSYTYQTAGQFTVTVTVYYDTTWSASDGTGGQLTAITGRTTAPVTVDEIQAVNNT